MRVKDIPQNFQLLQDSQEIEAVLEYLGCEEKFDFLFVKTNSGDIEAVYGGFNIPYVDGIVYEVI